MKAAVLAILLATTPTACQTIAVDLGIIAADLPTACGNLSALITQTAQQPLPAKVAQALNTANAKYYRYCGTGAVVAANTAAAIATIQQIISDIQAAKAAPNG